MSRSSPCRASFVGILLAATLALAGCAAPRVQSVQSPDDSATTTSGTPTLFGTTLDSRNVDGQPATLSDVEARVGTPQILRLFDEGIPPLWSQTSRQVDGIPVVVSFKADPTLILAGQYDEELTAWFRSLPGDRDTYWAYYHEPEDQIAAGDFTATQYRAAWLHLSALADAVHNRHLISTAVLMCWTVNPASGRNWRDYVAPGSVDVLAWDCYNLDWEYGRYVRPAVLLDNAVAASRSAHARWGISELGSIVATGDDGTHRARWLRAMGAYATTRHAAFVCYFDSQVAGDFELNDASSRNAWSALIRSSAMLVNHA